MSYLAEFRIRVRNRADNADLLVVTSVAGDSAPNYPYLKEPPKGDGASFNPLTGESMAASYTALVIDAIKSGTDRVLTSLLEDGASRLQLGYLKAFVEWRRDGGTYLTLCGGYLTLLRLIDASTWEITIQDGTRVHGGVELFNALSTTSITSFLSTWPNRGCLFGGPVKGAFLNEPDSGGWPMRVHQIVLPGGQNVYWLEFINFYQGIFGPPSWFMGPKGGPLIEAMAGILNDHARSLPRGDTWRAKTGSWSTIADTMTGTWRGVTLLVDGVPFRPVPPSWALVSYSPGTSRNPNDHQQDDLSDLIAPPGTPKPGVFAWLDAQTALTDGATVKVRALTILPSGVSPIYIDRHPVDVLTDIWTIAGLAYDATACTNLKNSDALGANLRVSRRITATETMGQFLKDTVLVPFQIGIRSDSQGRLVPFSTKVVLNTVPTRNITDANLVDGSVRLPFEQDVTQALQRITFRHKQQNVLIGVEPDGVVESDIELTLINGDASAMPSGTVEISVPGMVRTAPNAPAAHLDWLAGIAQPLFDRFGRGNQQMELELVRGDGTADADLLNLGDEVLVNIKQLANHNKRLGDDGTVGARAMQVIRLTELPARRALRLADSGPNANALSTLPTLTIAQSSDLPRTVAEVTVTNAATLNGLGYAVRIQMADTSGGAPASTDYVDVYTALYAAIPTGVIRMPARLAGRTVYVRARSEITASRPSNWSTGVSVALAAINDPTSVAAASVTGDGSQEDLTWAIGANATQCVTDIFVRAFGSAFATAVRQQTLPSGSTQFRLQNLTANTHYTASVQHRDALTQDVSNPIDVSFTTPNTTYALNPPINPHGFSYAVASIYGIVVSAREFPSDVEVAEAVETAPGSGTYGSFTTLPRIPSITGDWTQWTGSAPRDGKRRQLKARHVRDGTTVSAYTSIVTVTPWTNQAIPTYPIAAPFARITKVAAGTNRATEVVTLDGGLGLNDAGPLQWRYKLGSAPYQGYFTTTLPSSLSVTRAAGYDTPLVFEILQGDGQQAIAAYNIPARIEDGSPIPREDWHRGGFGGIATPRGIINPHTQYSGDGTTVLIDPVIGTVTVDLKAADGVKGIESTRGANTKGAHYAGHGAQGITGEGRTRVGKGGVEVPGASFETEPIYDSTGALALLDPVAKTATANLTGPTGIGMTVIERGGNKGDNALDSGFVAVAAAVDFSRGYTAKHMGNVPDDAGSDRRAATANQKTGGDRGFSAIDSGNIAVTGAVDFSRGYTNKTVDNISDGTTYKRVVGVSSNKITSSSSTSRNRCKVWAGGQSLTSGTEASVNFDNETFDVGSLHDTVTNNPRITIPTGGDVGVWELTAQVAFDSNATGYRYARIRKNGSTYLSYQSVQSANGNNTVITTTVKDDAPAVGDYYEVRVAQNSGGALSVTSGADFTFFSATHLW